MIVKEAISRGVEILKRAGVKAPVVEAGALLCSILECDRVFLYAHGDDAVKDGVLESYLEAVNKRAEGMPLQYITGHQEFMSLDFLVNSAVLIPRQDTEILVETVIRHVEQRFNMKRAGSRDAAVRILDIGTGSGCIAVSAAYYIRRCGVTAVDISEAALETARRNAVKNGVDSRIAFMRSHMFASLYGAGQYEKAFDVIVSNPPYIPAEQIRRLQKEVKDHEPLQALDGGADGLDFYRGIVRDAKDFLKPQGLLAFEVGYDQAEAVCVLMRGAFAEIGTVKDLAGIDRVVTGLLKE